MFCISLHNQEKNVYYSFLLSFRLYHPGFCSMKNCIVTLTIESILLLTATCNLKVQEVIGLCFVDLLSSIGGFYVAVEGPRRF